MEGQKKALMEAGYYFIRLAQAAESVGDTQTAMARYRDAANMFRIAADLTE